MGNRGVLHDDHRRLIRTSQVKRWIACRLEFRGRHRTVMAPHSYTELFFLDEATAFAAGHRPCAECRNSDYKRFRALWESLFGVVRTVDEIDGVLHRERLNGHVKRVTRADLATLPDGTFVSIDGIPWLVWRDELFAWSGAGYRRRQHRPSQRDVEVLTPPSIVEIYNAGYVPSVHPSVQRQ